MKSAKDSLDSPVKLPRVPKKELIEKSPSEVADHLYFAVLNATDSVNPNWDEQAKNLRNLPQRWRAVYTVCWLQSEVENGGHEQFFSNGHGEFDAETEADLRFIGAARFLELYTKARQLFYSAPSDYTQRIPEVEPIDGAFYKQSKTLYDLMGEHVLSHLEEYCAE